MSWHIVLPLAVFFLLPLPALWRAKIERRAYLIELYIFIVHYGFAEEVVSKTMTAYFKNSTYYYMNPFAKALTLAEAKAELAGDGALAKMVDELVAASI